MPKNPTKEAFCAHCGQAFQSRNRGTSRGWTQYCSVQCGAYATTYKGGPAASRRRRRYGLEPEDYQRMLDEQKGRCALCRAKPDYPLYVDHHHVTKRNRSLLCARCNTAVGVFDQLSWDEVLIYYGYSHCHDDGIALARALSGVTGRELYDEAGEPCES